MLSAFSEEKDQVRIELFVPIRLGSQLTGLDFSILTSVLQQHNSTDFIGYLHMKEIRCSSVEYFVRQSLGSPLSCMYIAQTQTVWSQCKTSKAFFHAVRKLVTLSWGESQRWFFGSHSKGINLPSVFYLVHFFFFLIKNGPLKSVKEKKKL